MGAPATRPNASLPPRFTQLVPEIHTMKSLFRGIAVAALAALTTIANTTDAQEASKTTAKAKPVTRAIATTKVRPLSVTVDLLSKTKLSGTLTDTTTLEMRTSFGTANIPLSEVAGVKFASASDASTTVVMLNGDSITGATDVKLVTVETEWGTATINGPNIASILFVPGLTWAPQAGLNGNRWNLANTRKEVAKPTSASRSTSSAVSRSSTTPSRSTTGSRYPSSVPQSAPTYRSR